MLLNRLAESHGHPTPGLLGATHHAFPEPADLTPGAVARLRNLGFSTRKAAAMFKLARRIAGGELDLESLQQTDDAAASPTLQHNRSGTVVGRVRPAAWARPAFEVFLGDDVGARNNLARRIGLASPLDYDDVRRAVAPWGPYAGLAYFHLLVERIDDAGWLDSGQAPDDRAEATFLRRA